MIDLFNGVTHHYDTRINRVAKALGWEPKGTPRQLIKELLEHCEIMASNELLKKISEIGNRK